MQVAELSNNPTTALATSSVHPLLASSNRDEIEIWRLDSGRRLTTLKGHSSWITGLQISHNGRLLASSSLDQTTKLWNLYTGQLLRTLHTGRVTSLAFSPDGRLLATASKNKLWLDGKTSQGEGVQLWDLETGYPLGTVGTGPVTAITFSPDGRFLVRGGNNTQFWDWRTGRLKRVLDSGPIVAFEFSADGNRFVTGSSKVKIWDSKTGKLLKMLDTGTSDLALSPDGQTLVVPSGGLMTVWNLANGQELGSLRSTFYSGLSVAYSPTGGTLVTGGSEGIRLWRAR